MDAAYSQELNHSPTLNAVALRYIHAFFNQVAQSAACADYTRLSSDAAAGC